MSGRLLVIVGPTAIGKSALALHLAKAFDGEIIGADSRQIYRHMSIGTAKPTHEQVAATLHHLIDIVNPDDEYSLVRFLRDAQEAFLTVKKNGRLPILVGGTGQYVWGFLEGWQVPAATPDPALRRRLEERADVEGHSALHRELAELDPEAAERIDARNVRRVVRALEVRYSDPDTPTRAGRKSPPKLNTKIIGLTAERKTLYRRIDSRVDEMMEAGWPDEVRLLLERGYGEGLPAMSGVGYRELVLHLEGELTREEAVARIKVQTHRFARAQYAWFRAGDDRIRWYDACGSHEAIEREVRAWLSTDGPEAQR